MGRAGGVSLGPEARPVKGQITAGQNAAVPSSCPADIQQGEARRAQEEAQGAGPWAQQQRCRWTGGQAGRLTDGRSSRFGAQADVAASTAALLLHSASHQRLPGADKRRRSWSGGTLMISGRSG